jgi:ribulose-5-phosphate 4-epimerase/fuculose-1-phosphate aldolase
MKDETGVIKFRCEWIAADPPEHGLVEELIEYRHTLFDKKMIGSYPDGIGYGNISVRERVDCFIISGTATGRLERVSNEHFTRVTAYSLEENRVTARGTVLASSESMTHAAIYHCDPTTNAVLHVHHPILWKKLLNKFPTSSADIEYGTPAMALEIVRLFLETTVASEKILVMAGHEDGIITFGRTLQEAYNRIEYALSIAGLDGKAKAGATD